MKAMVLDAVNAKNRGLFFTRNECVSAIVLESGGDEDQAIAALLHGHFRHLEDQEDSREP
jgi:hypothetical protein